MKRFVLVLTLLLSSCSTTPPPPRGVVAEASPARISWPTGLRVYDYIVIVVEENKDYEQIIDNSAASYINKTLNAEGANLTRMYSQEHQSEG